MPSPDTRSAPAVAAAVRSIFAGMFPKVKPVWLDTLFRDVEAIFTGRHPDYLPCDLPYHDLEHTLQVTLCYARIMQGRHQARAAPAITPRQFELGLAAALLHDVGYLKLRGDRAGSGAKYTYTHVLRSCAFAASCLPTLGANLAEVKGVLGAISCTGPTSEVARMHFHNAVEKLIGCAVATADYLGQMAAPDYPDELELLYREFAESDDYTHTTGAARAFKTSRALVENTPQFWERVVQPKLETNFLAMYRFLAVPYPHGPNPYIEAIERNLAIIQRRASGRRKKS